MDKENKPYFFKIFVGDHLSKRVKIPPDFLKHLSEDMSGKTRVKATIKGTAGCWPVQLRRTKNDAYLDNGWPKVVKDNSLGNQEFLLFRYDGRKFFNLQIFDMSGCERSTSSSTSKEDGIASQLVKMFYDSPNPHFKVCIRDSHLTGNRQLRMPKSFSQSYLPKDGAMQLILQNMDGDVWEVSTFLNQGAHCISKGWGSFVSANKLKRGDLCMFELLTEYEMRVQKLE